MRKDWRKISLLTVLVLLAAFSRLIPHPSNFTAIGAIAIFSAASLTNRWLSFIISMVSMWLSDLVLNNLFYSTSNIGTVWFTEGFVWIYLGIMVHWLAGGWIIRNKSLLAISTASLIGAISFFMLSNFGVWMGNMLYPKTWEGLVLCFASALPFFGNFLMGNLFFSGLLFGAYFLLEKKTSVFQTA